MGIFPSFPVPFRTVFLHPKPHLQKPATSLHFGESGPDGWEAAVQSQVCAPRSSHEHLTPPGSGYQEHS